MYICIHTYKCTHCFGIYKVIVTATRLRAGQGEINITFANCKQTLAFPIKLPGTRFWKQRMCPK